MCYCTGFTLDKRATLHRGKVLRFKLFPQCQCFILSLLFRGLWSLGAEEELCSARTLGAAPEWSVQPVWDGGGCSERHGGGKETVLRALKALYMTPFIHNSSFHLVPNTVWWGREPHGLDVLHRVRHPPVCRVLTTHPLHSHPGQTPPGAAGGQASWEDLVPTASGPRHRVCLPGGALSDRASHVLCV